MYLFLDSYSTLFFTANSVVSLFSECHSIQVQNNTHSIQTLTGQISKLVGTMEAWFTKLQDLRG